MCRAACLKGDLIAVPEHGTRARKTADFLKGDNVGAENANLVPEIVVVILRSGLPAKIDTWPACKVGNVPACNAQLVRDRGLREENRHACGSRETPIFHVVLPKVACPVTGNGSI